MLRYVMMLFLGSCLVIPARSSLPVARWPLLKASL